MKVMPSGIRYSAKSSESMQLEWFLLRPHCIDTAWIKPDHENEMKMRDF